MKPDSLSNKVLITGIDGFTGKYLESHLKSKGFDIYGTVVNDARQSNYFKCDIRDKGEVDNVISEVKPDFVIHIAAISFVGESNASLIYDVNVIGTENILYSLIEHKLNPQKIIIASSATVYGEQKNEILDESMCPNPINHYGCSKFAMEQMVSNFFNKLNIIITRPFNYTGTGQAEHFLIPKIVEHYKKRKSVIELGNLHVAREFNDVRDVCYLYEKLISSEIKSEVINICSGNAISLLDIIAIMNEISGYKINVEINPAFVRQNEIPILKGSVKKLQMLLESENKITINETLKSMYDGV